MLKVAGAVSAIFLLSGVFVALKYSDIPEEAKRELEDELGTTKSGKPCRVVQKWGDGYCNERECAPVRRDFLERNFGPNTTNTASDGLYDCFLDVDTEEYRLQEYKRAEELKSYKEQFLFQNRDSNGNCLRYQYLIDCKYSDDNKENTYCSACGRCIESPHVKVVVGVAIVILLTILITLQIMVLYN